MRNGGCRDLAIGACVVAATAGLACGDRTGLDALSSSSLPEVGVPEPDGAAGTCSICPAEHVCSGPFVCVEADGCTYGWCDEHGFHVDSTLCMASPPEITGWCASPTGQIACSSYPSVCGVEPVCVRTCVCNGMRDASGITAGDAAVGNNCGNVDCAPGCTCLCNNFCWCG
jgi:hypothetical protein